MNIQGMGGSTAINIFTLSVRARTYILESEVNRRQILTSKDDLALNRLIQIHYIQ